MLAHFWHPLEIMMKRFILAAALLGVFVAYGATEASAFKCIPGE